MKKMIFFDIDGTIITNGGTAIPHTIPESFHTALHALQAGGHLCFVNTGRSYAEIDTDILSLPFDGFVCGCGTYITHRDEVLLSHTIPLPLGNRILRSLGQHKLEWVLEGTKEICFSSQPYSTFIGDFKNGAASVSGRVRTLSPAELLNIAFDKFCVCATEASDYTGFYHEFQDTLTFIDRKNDFYEVVPIGYSKASGIQFLEKIFEIPREDTIAIGDSSNDLPMLQYAGLSIAMGNSSQDVIDAADYVTDAVLDDGILHAMQQIGLI